MVNEYIDVNRANWNSRVPIHARDYGMDRLRAEPTSLSEPVNFDKPRLGDIRGLNAVHLQCHLGTDTLSLARLGAKATGLDFSAPALEVARELARACHTEIDYVEAELYDAVSALGGDRFDLVYTGLGALCWLPSIERWANVVSRLLKPGGRLFIREAHPIVWTLSDPRPDELLVIEHPYFETTKGTEFVETISYTGQDAVVAEPRMINFNHGLGQILTAVMSAGLTLTSFEEHQSIPWNPFGAAGTGNANNEFSLRVLPERMPASYTLQATKL